MRPLCTSLIYVLAVLGLEAVMQKECEIVGILQDKLKYKERLQYMKYYFPLNYTVTVQYEEVLRTSNVSRLRDEAITEPSLRYLWFHVSSQVVLKIRDVLPEQHPSWSYTQELCDLLEGLGVEYEKYKQGGQFFCCNKMSSRRLCRLNSKRHPQSSPVTRSCAFIDSEVLSQEKSFR
ncbi:interleukin-34 isoform X3 [Alligator sinensis]|uniref:Interleukin-34 isoform X3 n=1 Tax=Alligator sinensis TaxID=38654 RepID=A0A3Q0H6B3_ALLSI|nr:interleukin-34 isoform X3 [Alligator sinensis]